MSFAKDDKNYQYNVHLKNWKVYKIYHYQEAGNYYGVVYLNDKSKQLVLAHRGTLIKWQDLFKDDSPLKTDLKGVLGGSIVAQQAAAYKSTKFAIIEAIAKEYNFSITGHSLGAWLAELSLFFIYRDFEEIKARAVTFDSPGSVMHIEQLMYNVVNDSTYFDVKELDIITYLSSPNFVNSCNKHVGKVYQVFPKYDIPDKINKTLSWYQRIKNLVSWGKKENTSLEWILSIFGHSMTNIISTFDPRTGVPIKYEEVLDWPVIKYVPYNNETKVSIINNWYKFANILLPYEINTLRNTIKDSTIMSLVHILVEAANGKINQEQYFNYFKHKENLGQKDFTKQLSESDEFYLMYEGHYKTKFVNLFEDILKDHNKNSVDWYLKQIKKKDKDIYQLVDSLGKKQLEEIKSHYIIVPNSKRTIISDKISIDQLREWIYVLVQVNSEVKNFLEDIKPLKEKNNLSKSGIISNYLPQDRPKYFLVGKSIGEINKILNMYQHVIITGLPGSGKSSYALEYAHIQKDKFIVRWLHADTADKLEIDYRNLAYELGIDTTLKCNKQVLKNMVNSKLANCKQPLLIIFDGVIEYSNIKDYLLNLPSNVKVIITTRNLNLNDQFKQIKLDSLTRESAILCIKNSPNNKLLDNQIEKLLDVLVTKSGDISPHKLSYAINYIDSNALLTIEKCIDYLKDNKKYDNAITLLMESLKTNPLAYKIIQYIARLDHSFINIDILEAVLLVNDKQLQEAINSLSAFGLVEIVKNKTDHKPGIIVHPLVQMEVIEYAEKYACNKDIINEETIYNKLLPILNSLFPQITLVPNDDWNIADSIYPHVKKILQKKVRVKQHVQAELYTKLGRYSEYVILKFKECLEYEEAGLKIRKKLNQGNHPDVARSLIKVGWAYFNLGDVGKGLIFQEQALRMYQALYSGNHPDVANSLSAVGQFYDDLGDAQKSLTYYQQALEMRQKLYQNNHPKTANSLNNVGWAYRNLGNIQQGLVFHEQALKMRQELYQGNHPDIAQSLNHIGSAYKTLRDAKKGLIFQEQALRMYQALYSGIHPDIAQSLNNVGCIYRELGDTQKGLLLQEQALKMRKELYQGNHPEIARSLNDIGVTYLALGNMQKALKFHEQALKMRQELYHNNHPDIAESLSNIGITYLALGNMQKALDSYQKAYARFVNSLGPDHPRAKELRENIIELTNDPKRIKIN